MLKLDSSNCAKVPVGLIVWMCCCALRRLKISNPRTAAVGTVLFSSSWQGWESAAKVTLIQVRDPLAACSHSMPNCWFFGQGRRLAAQQRASWLDLSKILINLVSQTYFLSLSRGKGASNSLIYCVGA